MNNKILVISVGNDIMGDDGAAFEASKQIQEHFSDNIDFENVYGGGFELFDLMENRDKTLILDTISDGVHPVGTVIEIEKSDFRKIMASSPHYIGLPEVLRMAEMFEINFPNEIKILAIEIDVQHEVKEGLSPEILQAMPAYIDRAVTIIHKWL